MQLDRIAERHHAVLLERSDHGGGSHPPGRARLPDQAVREAGTGCGVPEVRQKQQLRSENQALREYCEQLTEDLSFLAASPQMLNIRQQILQIAPVDVPVFISGESGVGKEVVARMIHLRSTRRQPAVHQGKLRGAARRTAGIGAIRLRTGRVHRRGALEARQIRTGEQGHDFPGRNRGDEPAPAGQAAARASGRPVLAAGRRVRW